MSRGKLRPSSSLSKIRCDTETIGFSVPGSDVMWRPNPVGRKGVRTLARPRCLETLRNHSFWDSIPLLTSTVYTELVGDGSVIDARNTRTSSSALSRLEGLLALVGLVGLSLRR